MQKMPSLTIPSLTRFSCLLGFTLLPMTMVSAQTILFDNFDDMTDATALNGRTPSTTSTGVGTWVANANFDGTTSGGAVSTNGAQGSATIGFDAIETGNIYELSADVLVNADNTEWFGIGFNNNEPLGSTLFDNSTQRGFIFLRGNGDVRVYSGSSSQIVDLSGFGAAATEQNLKLVLDTTVDSAWTLAAYVDDVQIDLDTGSSSMVYTYSSNLTLSRAGFSGTSGMPAGSYIDNFSLATIPEPGSVAAMLGGLSALVCMVMHRRRRR